MMELKHIYMQVEKWDWNFNSHDLNIMLRSGKPTVLDINLCVCLCVFVHAFLELKHVTMQVEKRNRTFSSHDLKHWAEKWGKPTVLDVNLCVCLYTCFPGIEAYNYAS